MEKSEIIKSVKSIVLVILLVFGPLSLIGSGLIKSNQPGQYNIVWETPSTGPNGSMPLGNGDIGLNVWVENNGDICFFIGKTDSWGEDGRLLKVGKVRIKSEPALVSAGTKFRQELDLASGSILISSIGEIKGKTTELNFRLWVDANNPVAHIEYYSPKPVKIIASVELWRNQPYELNNASFSDLLQSHSDADKMREPAIIQPDVIEINAKNQIVWYHHNSTSQGVEYTNKLQGITEFVKSGPILGRTFGAVLKATNTTRANQTSIETSPKEKGAVSVFVLTKHPSSPEEWKEEMVTLVENIEKTAPEKRRKGHEGWWSEFWGRSWIEAVPADTSQISVQNSDAFIVSRAYVLQRFINACAGRGAHPIKFNGSIFTVPSKNAIPADDPDYRRWGPGYWWQNTRLPYLGMCTSGDFDLIQPLFKMYAGDIFEICKLRTKNNFGFEGAYFPECMYFWGAQFPIDYGPKPWEERTDKLQDSQWHKWEWVSGPELVFMMLDYYDYTQDKNFLKGKIIPLANEVIKFFDNFYQTNEGGKLVMYPSQSAETWWDCTNPMPEVAGLYSITQRLLSLPGDITTAQDRQFWMAIREKLPDIPTRKIESKTALAPAERFELKRNEENPELYAVFPFRLFGVGNPNLEWGINALDFRFDKGNFGWRQDDIFMAYLGLSEQAKSYLVARANNYNKDSRFPAFWGPNYDWIPDQDHGGVLMKTFQSMLLQPDPYSEKIYLLPAWPKEWNARFKLHAPYNTIIEGEVVEGKVKSLNVTPQSRQKDVIIAEGYVYPIHP